MDPGSSRLPRRGPAVPQEFRKNCSNIVTGALEIGFGDSNSSARAGIWTKGPRQRSVYF